MRTWADDANIVPRSATLDRDAGDGPAVRCCAQRFVAADALVFFGDLDAANRALVRGRLPTVAAAADADLYLCGSCREILRRERVITRRDMPTSRPLRLPDAL